jgi:hypothetical protein
MYERTVIYHTNCQICGGAGRELLLSFGLSIGAMESDVALLSDGPERTLGGAVARRISGAVARFSDLSGSIGSTAHGESRALREH